MTAPKSFLELTKWLLPAGAISLMFLALAGCNSRKDEVSAQSAAMAANPSEATESQPPLSKKDEVPAQSAVTSEKPFEVTYCQLLLSEAEVVEQGIDRQRRMYPRGSKLRISAQAAEEGFNAATRKEAMACFNQAWRFNPENPMAYWGAGIIRGCEAKKFSENNMIDFARKCWNDCLKLFEIAEKLIDNVPQEKVFFQVHLAQTYTSYAVAMKDDLDDQGKAMLEKAKALVLQYYDCKLFEPEANKQVQMRAGWQLWEIYTALGNSAEAEKYKKDAEEIEKERRLPGDIKWGE